jgi:secretion/DNA translocation related TadE-like protein
MTRRDRGAATIWALALTNALLLIGLAAAGVASLAVSRQRVATVADVAAVAAAQAVGDPCAEAGASVAANGMVLEACATDGTDIVVVVSTEATGVARRLLGLVGRAAPVITASARAGPP